MKPKSFFNILMLLILSSGLFFTSAQARPAARPLEASGDFSWAKAIGGSGQDISNDIVVDSNGNVYTTGRFNGTVDFDPGAGTSNLISAGGTDIFISKLDASGNFVWVKQIGAAGSEDSFAINLDSSGNIYITGIFFSSTIDFDPGAGIANLTATANDSYVLKLDSNGNFVWVKQIVATALVTALGLAFDSSNNVYLNGRFASTVDFDPGVGIANRTSAGSMDLFVLKLDSNGNFIWVQAIGGTGFESARNIVVASSGNVYMTGSFSNTVDFDPGAGTTSLVSAGLSDAYVLKLDSGGNFVWAKQMGGPADDGAIGIALDANENVYTTGSFVSAPADFDPGAGTFNLSSAGGSDVYVSKLDSAGNFVYAVSAGGGGVEEGYSLVSESDGTLYVTGRFGATVDFDPGAGTTNLVSAGISDVFIWKLDSSGALISAKQMGGAGTDLGYVVTIAPNGNVYVTGNFTVTADLDPSAGVSNFISAGAEDIFIVKLEGDPVLATSKFTSAGTQDGWVLESSETSVKGGTLNKTGKIFNLGDDVANKQYRGILSFKTDALPDAVTLTKVTLKVKKSGITGGGNPIKTFKGFVVDIKQGMFGKSALALGDFQAKGNKTLGVIAPYSSGWYSLNLTSAGLYINKTTTNSGLTQIRLRFKLDDNNNSVANFLKLFSGNALAASRPQLIVEYYVP